MIVDTSALVALVTDEPAAAAIADALRAAQRARMSAASYLELGIVLDARTEPRVARQFDALLTHLGVDVVAVTPAQARIARAAYRDFGRGSGHAAHLNYGDCFSYALAIEADEPLLFIGEDFSHTDVRTVL